MRKKADQAALDGAIRHLTTRDVLLRQAVEAHTGLQRRAGLKRDLPPWHGSWWTNSFRRLPLHPFGRR